MRKKMTSGKRESVGEPATFQGCLHGYPSAFDAFCFINRKSYGPVRCGFKKESGNLTVRLGAACRHCKSYCVARCCDASYGAARCGSVQFSKTEKPTVRFCAVFKIENAAERFGAVFRNQEYHGAVRCGFQTYRKSYYGAVRCCDASYDAVRCGSPLIGFDDGAVLIPVGWENRTKTVFLHRAPYIQRKTYTTLFLMVFSTGSSFSRGTNETAVSLR